MKIVISSGHGLLVAGASGLIDEVQEARKVVKRVTENLRAMGAYVIDFHENEKTNGNDNLNAIIAYHNAQDRDLDVSVHFNSVAGGIREQGIGTETYYYSEAGKAYAERVSSAIASASGLINRGAKQSLTFGFLRRTAKPAILIEVCFVNSRFDVIKYREHFNGICRAIADAIIDKQNEAPIDTKDTVLVTAICPSCGANASTIGYRINGTVYAPVRALCEQLGHVVEYADDIVTVK